MSTSCIKILIIIIIVIIINRLNWLAILIEAAHAIIHTIIVGSYPTLQFNTIPTAHPVSNATSKWRSQAFFFSTSTGKTSRLLWQYHQSYPRRAWVFQSCLLWTWLPDIPKSKYGKKNITRPQSPLVFHLKYLRGKRVGGACGERTSLSRSIRNRLQMIRDDWVRLSEQ